MDETTLELAERLSQATVDAGRALAAKTDQKPDGFNGNCTECGHEIPKERIELGFYVCVPCKEQGEGNRYRKPRRA